MIVKATFIGENSAKYVYRHGIEYVLWVQESALYPIVISELSKGGKKSNACPYSSITAFLKNWNNIKRFD